MSARCKWVFIVVATILGLGMMCGPATAGSDEELLRTIGEKWVNSKTIEERIDLMEQRIVVLQRLLREKKDFKRLIFEIAMQGYADKERGEKAYNEAESDIEELEYDIRHAKKYLTRLKTMRDAQYKEAKEKELKNVALVQEQFRIVQLHRQVRATAAMTSLDVALHMHSLAVLTSIMLNNNLATIALIYRINQAIAAAQRGSEGGGGSQCFVAGTLVLMADGTFKPIEQVAVGDKVFSRDGPDGEYIGAEVYKVLRGAEEFVYTFDDGLQVNADHNFYTDKGPVMARDLTPGMTLLGRDSSRVLASIERQGPALASSRTDSLPNIPVHNIMVRGTHTFFVSPDGNNTYMVLDISACGK